MSERPIFFVADLHGHRDRYEKLFNLLREDTPGALLIGGDLLPRLDPQDFLQGFFLPRLQKTILGLRNRRPWIGLILGNDDPRVFETDIRDWEKAGLVHYLHGCGRQYEEWLIYGYACVPPTPFLFKDWERYDVSRYIDPGCIPPEEGIRSVPEEKNAAFITIQEDLMILTAEVDMDRSIFLFHSPPHQTNLDHLAGEVRLIDHAPIDMHVGSIAIRRMIEEKQPRVTLHGHIHESARVTGSWCDRVGETVCFTAAHDGPELAVIRFLPGNPGAAERIIL